jgi:phytoene/squalene synthetase
VEIRVVKHIKEVFSKEVELFANNAQCTYLEALVELAQRKDIELEIVPRLITTRLRELLEEEAASLNLLTEKKNKLPID